jgi:general stress protein YciG
MLASSPTDSPSPSPLTHGPSGAEWAAAHDTLKADDELWRSLAFEGVQHDGQGGLLEHRRCPRCGSTLSRAISPELAREVCQHQAAVHALSEEAIADAGKASPKQRRGFAAMSPEQHRAIARLGGLTAQRDGKAHRFSSEEARAAGRKGGQALSTDTDHMAKIGRRGGKAPKSPRRR